MNSFMLLNLSYMGQTKVVPPSLIGGKTKALYIHLYCVPTNQCQVYPAVVFYTAIPHQIPWRSEREVRLTISLLFWQIFLVINILTTHEVFQDVSSEVRRFIFQQLRLHEKFIYFKEVLRTQTRNKRFFHWTGTFLTLRVASSQVYFF